MGTSPEGRGDTTRRAPQSPPGPSVASRVLATLAAFDDDHRELTLSEIARRARLPTSTAHRLIRDLVEWGALERHVGGGYSIGQRLWRLGTLAGPPGGLREVASPFLHDVYATTLATVHLAVRDGTEALFIARLAGRRSVPILSTEGSRSPLHSTAVGKVLLAHAPPEVAAEVLANLTRLTTHTIIAPGALGRQLRRIHEDGFATSHEEMSLGADAVAVPIHSGDRVIAALGVAVDISVRDTARLVTALKVAARGIGRSLGGNFQG